MGILRGAIAGCGFFGNIQIEAWRRMPEVELIAACDPMMERAQSSAPHAYTDVERMLDEQRPDFLDIATRPDTHLPLVRMAVERRIPAIVQKPLAESLDQAREMIALVEASGVPVMVHENWRWQPWYREVKRRMDAGDIGQPLTYTFRIRQRDGLGDNPFPNQPYFRLMPRLLIYETLIHPMDTARFLFGEIDSLQAFAKRHNPLIAGEDRAVVLMNHVGTVDGVIDGSRYTNPEPPGPAMGDAIFEGTEGVLRVLANGEVYAGASLLTRHATDTGYKGDSVRATQQHFIDCLRTGAKFETGVRDYFGSFAAVDAAYQSIAQGRVISPSR